MGSVLLRPQPVCRENSAPEERGAAELQAAEPQPPPSGLFPSPLGESELTSPLIPQTPTFSF